MALLFNLGVACAKVIGAVVSGSTVMSAEAAHAFADTGNQVLLIIAQRRSVRPGDQRHPLGYGREAYFWALIASVVVFTTGAAIAGDLIGFIGVALHQWTGSSVPEGIAAVIIGVLLVGVGLELARRNRDSHWSAFIARVDIAPIGATAPVRVSTEERPTLR